MTEALGKVAENFRDDLRRGLGCLLLGSEPPPGWGIKPKRKRR
jgi:hypothetical protein